MNIEQIRKETPGCHDKIFLNSAGSSLMPRQVVEKIHQYLIEEEDLGGYRVAEMKKHVIDEFYSETARLINCRPHNIAFANNASEAFARALSSFDFKKGDVIITTDDDYVSNHINFISLKKRYGIEIQRIRTLENGDLDILHFVQLIEKKHPVLVSVTHIPTNSGLIQDVEKIGSICQQNQITLIVDACQSIGQIDVDVEKIKCDFLCTSGRKFLRGPRGTGFLYVSDKLLNDKVSPLYVELRGATMTSPDEYKIENTAKRFETWELPYALIIGLKEAIRYANDLGISEIEKTNANLMDHFRNELRHITHVNQHDKGTRKGSILTFDKSGKNLSEVIKTLDECNVYYSVSTKEGAIIDFGKKQVEWAIRLSPHYFNTFDEINRISEILENI